MRLLIVSDTHGRTDLLMQAIENEPTARDVCFLGDGLRDLEAAAERFPDRNFYAVSGNCDLFCADYPLLGNALFGGKRVVYMHGHVQNVKYGLDRAVYTAREREADVLLFGHTHVPLCTYEDGLHILNPGSLGHGRTYGIADITAGGIFIDVREVRR